MKNVAFIVFVFVLNFIRAQQTFELCAGEAKTVTYFSTSTGDGITSWTVNSVPYNTEELTYTYNAGGTYNIVVKRENGLCYVEETFQAIVTECPGIIYWIPNSFTPDGNEYNQTFGPVMVDGFDIDGFEFTVFNRWGDIVWQSFDPEGKWNGSFNDRVCQDGVYIWKLRFGVFGNDEKILDHGHLTIIR